MNRLVDKLILFVCCLALFASTVDTVYKIVPVLIVIIFSALLSYVEEQKLSIGLFFIFIGLSFYNQQLIYFLPLIAYDMMKGSLPWLPVLAFLPYFSNLASLAVSGMTMIPLFIGLGYFLKDRTMTLETMKRDYCRLRDNTKETAIQLEKKNQDLMEKQDYELNLATLAERNRIARDIHDNVGHLLSRSLLQDRCASGHNQRRYDQRRADSDEGNPDRSHGQY